MTRDTPLPPPSGTGSEPLLFLSYHPSDARSREELEAHLRVLEIESGLEIWSNQRIEVGDRRQARTEEALKRARLAVILVSPDYLADDALRDGELRPLLQAAEEDRVRVLWIPVRPSLVLQTPLGSLQPARSPQDPLSELSRADREEAWTDISRQILAAWEAVSKAAPASATGPATDAAAPEPSSPPEAAPAEPPPDAPTEPPEPQPPTPEPPKPVPSKSEPPPGRSRTLGSWVFGLLTLGFLAFAYFAPTPITGARWPILRVVAALAAALFGFFLTGRLTAKTGDAAGWAVRGTGGFALFLLVFFFWPSPTPELYRLQVTVRDPGGSITTDAALTVRPGGTVQKSNGGWTVEVSPGQLSDQRRVLLEATAHGARGEETVKLADNYRPEVEIRMEEADVPGPLLPAYRIRVTVADPSGTVTDDAVVTARPVGDVQKTARGWVVEVPGALVADDRTLTLQASRPGWPPAETELVLGADPNPAAEIRLKAPANADIRGRVVDARGSGLAGATVSVLGYGEEAVTTDATGSFRIPAHAPEGEMVRLQITAPGHTPKNPDVPAGSRTTTVQMLPEDG